MNEFNTVSVYNLSNIRNENDNEPIWDKNVNEESLKNLNNGFLNFIKK